MSTSSTTRSTTRLAIFAASVVWCAAALAVDTPRKPIPVVDPSAAAVQAVPPHLAPATESENRWRFKYHNNRWWYWLPNETWVYWSGERWLTYDPVTFVRDTQPQLAYAAPARGSRGSTYYGRGRNYYGNNYNRPVAVPFYGYPGMSPYPGGGFRFGIIN